MKSISRLFAATAAMLSSIGLAGREIRSQRNRDKGYTPPSTKPPENVVVKSKKNLKKFKKEKKGSVVFNVATRRNPFRGIVGPRVKMRSVQVITGVKEV